ncbi:MAG: efflux transporter outer membrane subunit [Burkholderiales bacterium]|nr:efflux transporter outer membrane subunit [Burkholderiales bacterium]
MKYKTLPLLLSAALLSGCAYLTPSYERPDAPVADQWSIEGLAAAPSGNQTARLTPWRAFFGNADLQQLIETALQNNRDLRVTALNVERVQALYRIQRADQFPTLAGVASGQGQGSYSDNIPTTHAYSVGLGVSSFELDLFGRVASLKNQALESYLSSESALKSARIALIANVANAYYNLIADREHLKVSRETLKNQRDSYQLIKTRYDHGVASELALRQAQMTMESSRVDVASYSTKVAQDVNALVLLLGTKGLPKVLTGEMVVEIGEMPALNLGEVPSDVLKQRPDIISAEHSLKAAYANIGAARAAFFPRIALTAQTGYASNALSGLFDAGTSAWSFAANLTLPIFDTGRNLANLDAANVGRDIAVAEYERAIQVAFREVSDALAQRATIDEQLDAQTALFDAAQASQKLSTARYEKGVDSYLNVLDAERSMYSARQGLVNLQLAKQVNQIMLYKALGGGLQ